MFYVFMGRYAIMDSTGRHHIREIASFIVLCSFITLSSDAGFIVGGRCMRLSPALSVV